MIPGQRLFIPIWILVTKKLVYNHSVCRSPFYLQLKSFLVEKGKYMEEKCSVDLVAHCYKK